MKFAIKKIPYAIALCYLPFFLLLTYSRLFEPGHAISYWEEIFFLFLGPVKLSLMDPKILFLQLGSDQINWLGLIPFILMISFISFGAAKFDRSLRYRVLFALGIMIWFLFGMVAVGIHQLTT